MVDGSGLENQHVRKGIVGSNPTPSVFKIQFLQNFLSKTEREGFKNIFFEVIIKPILFESMIRVKKIRNMWAIFLIALIIFNPNPLLAKDSAQSNEAKSLEIKVAKGYSNKFCNAIAMGVSKESAIRLSIEENTKPIFNTSLWLDLVVKGDEEINQIEKESLASTIAENIVRDCGQALNLNGQKGVDEFLTYFSPIFNAG